MKHEKKNSMKNKSQLFWLMCLLAAGGLALFSCLEGDGLWLDENGFCQPVNIWANAECPELCDPRNAKHFCYCDTTDYNDTCLACDVTDTSAPCYDSCKVLVVDAAGKKSLTNTCGNKNGKNGNHGDCPKDPLNPCTPECADQRTIDYATQIAPIWANNACVKGCHTRGSQGFTNTGNLRKIKVIQNGKDTSVYRGISFQPELNVLSMLINVPDWSDSTKHPKWRVRPFAPDSSYLLYILSNPGKKPGEVRMPNNLPEVPEASKKLIEQWILEGACPSP